MPRYFGLERTEEQPKEVILRDIRSQSTRVLQKLWDREGSILFHLCLFAVLWLAPGFWFLLALLALFFYAVRAVYVHRAHLPMRLPKNAPFTDYSAPKPGGGFKGAEGLFYLGNDLEGEGCELWISKEDLLTHLLVLGTTGAGKTETLVSFCYNYLVLGSGVIYVDPKAAPRLGAELYTMARLLGREDDFLLVNYLGATKTQIQETPLRQSNTQNPFAVGDANQLMQLLFALMPVTDGTNSVFSSNAQALISGLLFVLVERRDKGLETLSIETIRTYLNDVAKIDALARDEETYSQTASLALQTGLTTVGWDKNKPWHSQGRTFPEQFGYARAYFGRALSLLVDNYGAIFQVPQGEVDMVDVIINRRIFVTMLPSIAKDPKELKQLGQICLAGVRNACAVGLGETVQGPLGKVLGALPTSFRQPFGIVVDEYAAIETPGFEILLTQGRGLGMSCVVASQDFAGLKRASATAAEQIVANCKTKLFMATEDPKETADLVHKLAGSGYVFKSKGFKQETGLGAYHDTREANADSVQRIDFRDLQRQVEGEATIAFKGAMIRARLFYADLPLEKDQQVRLNFQLLCAAPQLEDVQSLLGPTARLIAELKGCAERPSREEERVLGPIGDFFAKSALRSLSREEEVLALLAQLTLLWQVFTGGDDTEADAWLMHAELSNFGDGWEGVFGREDREQEEARLLAAQCVENSLAQREEGKVEQPTTADEASLPVAREVKRQLQEMLTTSFPPNKKTS